MDKSQVPILKQSSKDCMRKDNHTEAFFHLTHALKISPEDTELLSLRSKCLLVNQQFYLALQDSETIISIADNLSVGHVRRGEVCFATFNFPLALESFKRGFQCGDSDKNLVMDWMTRCKREIARDLATDKQFPWVGAALGIIGSSLLLVLHFLAYSLEEDRDIGWMDHPAVKVVVVVVSAVMSRWAATQYRGYVKNTRKGFLEPPVDLLEHLHND